MICGKTPYFRVVMRTLGFSRLLQLVVVLPLVALTAFSGILVLDTLNGYRDIKRVAELEQLVVAASRLTTVAVYGGR